MAVDRFEKWRFRNSDGILVENDVELWGNLKGNSGLAAEHGAGAIGTIPIVTTRTIIDGAIVKTIRVDLDGLQVLGTQAKDAIGLSAGGAAYIGRYVTATDGICFKIEMVCLVAPTQETATITQDIDLGADDDATITEGGDPIDDIIINTNTLVVTETATKTTPALTADDYIYLIEGDTAASTGEYSGGQFLIRFFGYPVFT